MVSFYKIKASIMYRTDKKHDQTQFPDADI